MKYCPWSGQILGTVQITAIRPSSHNQSLWYSVWVFWRCVCDNVVLAPRLWASEVMSWLVWDRKWFEFDACVFCTLWLDQTIMMKLNVLIWELWLTDGGCVGAVGVWFGECGAGVMLICASRETGSCLPVCHASICVSQFTPSLPISTAALGHSMGFNMAGDYSENTHTNANHLLCHEEHPTFTLSRVVHPLYH